MYQEGCLNKPSAVEKIRSLSDALNAEVVERVNGSQELVQLKNFSSECNEYHIRKSFQERYSNCKINLLSTCVSLYKLLQQVTKAFKQQLVMLIW